MQVKPKDFNPDIHEKFKGLSVMQPYAEYIRTGEKPLELRNHNTNYRGDVVICSTAKFVDGFQSSCTLALVELYGVKKVSELSPEELKSTKAEGKVLERYKDGFAWQLRNPRPLIEFPVKGQLGLFTLVFTKDCIMPYPTVAKLIELPIRKQKLGLRRFLLRLIENL